MVLGRETKFAKTIPQEVGNEHVCSFGTRIRDANGKVDMIEGILCYHAICWF
jgi:hypothetical protein